MDSYITLTEAAKLSPGRPSSCAVWRWCRVGLKSRNGERIKLRHSRVGGRIFTTESDLSEFFRAVADADRQYFEADPPATSKPATNGQRQRSIASAEKKLQQAGILR